MRQFLVLESNPLVAEDLAEALRTGCEGCVVAVAASIEEATDLLAKTKDLTAAFLRAPFDALKDSGLPQRITELGAQLVVFDDTGLCEDVQGWIMLPTPFTNDMIEQALARIAPGDS
ncbi:hypothetical protein [Aliiroseovarius sp. YM-037]|uniref:hypothetical protein n=1 Tax=Aliiroseovarius sp. YM-037 TaxID=3341728 RepID=UPI003A80115E